MQIHQMDMEYAKQLVLQHLINMQMIYLDNVFHLVQMIILHNLIQENAFHTAHKHMDYLQIQLIKLALLHVIELLIHSLTRLQCNV